MSAWHVTVRTGPRVERLRTDTLAEALDLLEGRTRAAAVAEGRRGAIELRYRRYEPGEQVVARAELRGPGRWFPEIRAGFDLRGDGEVQAWTGGVKRALVTAEAGETPYQALRRVLGAERV